MNNIGYIVSLNSSEKSRCSDEKKEKIIVFGGCNRFPLSTPALFGFTLGNVMPVP